MNSFPRGVVLGLTTAALLAAQLVGPARPDARVDPLMRLEVQGPVPAHVATTLRRACYDCHSNETRWPWYSRVAPVSWLVIHDVTEGRGRVNFSEWGTYNAFDRADMLDEACELARKGEMPLRPYLFLHPDAKLTPTDVDALCNWTRAEAARLTGPAKDDPGMRE